MKCDYSSRFGSAAAQQQIPSKVDVAFNRFYNYDEYTAVLNKLTAAYPELLTLQSIGKSEQGRDMWLVTLVGWFGDHPPADPAGYVEWTRGMPTVEFYETIKDAEICSPIAIHKFPSNRRRHYERMPRFPDGLAVIGDALCSFNPIYGQGMSTGALGAATLDSSLQELRQRAGAARGFSMRFQKQLAKVIDAPWMTVTGEDFRYEQAEGTRPFWTKALGWYTGRVYRLAREDEHVSRRFLQVMHLMAKPTVLFEPYVLRRVLLLGAESPPMTSTAPPAREPQPTG